MLFNEELLEKIENNPVGAVIEACDRTIAAVSSDQPGWSPEELDTLMETAALVNEIIKNHMLQSKRVLPEITGDLERNCNQLLSYLTMIQAEFQGQAYEIKFSAIQNRYKTALKSTFAYEFSQGDLERVQTLINELRAQLTDIDSLESEHKKRLLIRLEKLQSELHKRVSDLDRFWGMVGDAGVVLGKLGKDAKPIVDRIKEITDIVWRTQSRAEELPSDTRPPLLEIKENIE